MFYRVLAVGIVAFWLLTMALLVRMEFSPADTEFLPVPPEYVWKLMFLHDQSSDLVLYNGRRRLGIFHLQPRRLPTGTDGAAGPVRLLTGSGTLLLSLPGMAAQNLALRGSVEVNEQNLVEHFMLNVGFREAKQSAAGMTIVLDGQPARDRWHYQLRRGDVVLQEDTGTSAILLDAFDVRSLGIDPQSILLMERQQAARATMTARRGVLHMNGEDIESYIVTVSHGESLDTTIYINQLGQILAVKTFAGYDLYDDTLTP